MICKRCEVYQVKPERMINGFCRHCTQALREPDGGSLFIFEDNNG